jgi:hypothetical protein
MLNGCAIVKNSWTFTSTTICGSIPDSFHTGRVTSASAEYLLPFAVVAFPRTSLLVSHSALHLRLRVTHGCFILCVVLLSLGNLPFLLIKHQRFYILTFYVFGLIMSNFEVCDVEASDDSVTNTGRGV